MKRSICRFTHSTTVIVTALFFCMMIILATPVLSKAASDTAAAKPKASRVDRTEAQITDLHTKLQITPAQEDQWKNVALAMRENASQMDILLYNRKAQLGTLNAVDNLKSYKDVSDAHTAGLAKFIAAFEPLYASISDAQKANADTIFAAKMARQGQHRGHKHTKK